MKTFIHLCFIFSLWLMVLFHCADTFFLFDWLFFRSPTNNVPVSIPRNCGRLFQNRIIGGVRASPHSWPWMASIQNYADNNFCGGVIITERHVLSAAHCFSTYKYIPFLLKVVIGSNRLGFGDTLFVDSVIIHPSFRKRALYDSDLAILRLSSNIKFYGGINCICLPEMNLNPSISPDEYVTVLGWGFLSENGRGVLNLREVDVQVLLDEDCQNYKGFLRDVMICAGWKEGRKDSCKGDSGGPLLRQSQDGKWYVYGLVSFGKGCARRGFPGVYTKVNHFKQWIIDTINVN